MSRGRLGDQLSNERAIQEFMRDQVIISLDAMGGDQGPEVVISGADLALVRHPGLQLVMFGDSTKIEAILERYPRVKQAVTVEHTDVSVAMDAKPSQALRQGRRVSSMWRAIEAVADQRAHAAVSAGNTGALMAMSRFILRTLPGIERPAIAAIWPSVRGESIVLDVGANVGADADQLVDYAVMGEAMARTVFGNPAPTVGLLNVGVEEVKGVEQVREAARRLRNEELPISYYGFVEGNDIGRGTVDVFVTEGFTGNIALKTAEGTAQQIATYLKDAMSRTLMSKIGYLFARGAFRALREKMDPRSVNGGVFLGLNGIVVKSHGGTDAMGFASAIDLAIDMARNDMNAKIARGIELYHAQIGNGSAAAPAEAAAK